MKLTLLQLGMHSLSGVPVPAYLIETDDHRRILVDTGFAPPRGENGRAPYWFRVSKTDNIVHQLSCLGLTPDDLDYLVCSHFDPDHCGNHEHFSRAECIVQRTHYELGRSGLHDRFESGRVHWDLPQLHYSQIEGSQQLIQGVELIESTGHVPGHQSVLVNLPKTGSVLLAVDAIPTASQSNPATWKPHHFDMDPVLTAATAKRLMQLAVNRNVNLVIFGHDAAQWKTLQHAPFFYD